MTEQPLYVRVAAALGWTDLKLVDELRNRHPDGSYQKVWVGIPPSGKKGCGPAAGYRGSRVPLYDSDWGAMGPVIEKFRIGLNPSQRNEYWYADAMSENDFLGTTCPHIGRGAGFAPCADESKHPLVSACIALLELRARDPLPTETPAGVALNRMLRRRQSE